MILWLRGPKAFDLKSIPALREATFACILPLTYGFLLCQLVWLAQNEGTELLLHPPYPRLGGKATQRFSGPGSVSHAYATNYQPPPCFSPPLALKWLTDFSPLSSCKNTCTHQHTCVLGLKSQVPRFSPESMFIVGYTSPEIEAPNGNADRSLTLTAQTQTGAPFFPTLPPFCLSAEFSRPRIWRE